MEKSNLATWVKAFKEGKISRRELLIELNTLILNTPNYYGNYDIDIKYEFYAEVISKIEKILSYYKEIPNATFTTWFNFVLKREFYLFIIRHQKNELETVEYIDEIKKNDIYSNQSCNYNFDFSCLTEKEQEILALKFGVFFPDYQTDDSNLIIVDKINRKRTIEQKITARYIKIINLQKKIQKEEDSSVIKDLKEKLNKTTISKRRLEYLFNRFNLMPSNQWVAEKLGISTGTVGAFLNKIKIKMQKNNDLRKKSG
jgi:hypothetical protein